MPPGKCLEIKRHLGLKKSWPAKSIHSLGLVGISAPSEEEKHNREPSRLFRAGRDFGMSRGIMPDCDELRDTGKATFRVGKRQGNVKRTLATQASPEKDRWSVVGLAYALVSR